MKKTIKRKDTEGGEEEEELQEEELVDDEADEEAEEEAVNKLAESIRVKLNLKELENKINRMVGRSAHVGRESLVASKIYAADDVKKAVGELTEEEIIVGFFQALVRNDHVVLRAMSEGVPADGGYLFPDEFRAQLIRDLAEPTRMRSLVTVIPMKRDVLKVPKLVSRPQVRWTSEGAAKSTTTAEFTEKTLTVYKLAAILYALISGAYEFCTRLIAKTVNSVNILVERTTPSQVRLAIS